MYYVKIEKEKVFKIEECDKDFFEIENGVDIEKILFIKNEEYIIGSKDKNTIEKCYSLICFLKHYKYLKKILSNEMNLYNINLVNEENKYIKDLLDIFKDLNSDGKFIRGFLILFGYEIISKMNDYARVLPLSLAFELFQTSVLIHDDIIDNANLRRGKKTIPIRYSEKYKNANHLGDSLAICAGDIGFYKANELLIENYYKNKFLLKYFNDIVINTIRGEILDVVLPHIQKYKYFDDNNLEKYVMDIYRLKTSWYSIVGPLCVGMILGGASKKEVTEMEELAYNLGIAFQIKDDILGIYSDSVKCEKTASDISEFKQTILYSYVYDKNKKYLNKLNKYYGKDCLTNKDVENVRDIFKDSGALDYANNIMEKLFEESNKKLNKMLYVSEKDKNILEGFMIYLKIRNK